MRIVKYRNYGCQMVGEQQSHDDVEHRFHWSFFELTSNVIVSVQYIQNWQNNVMIDDDLYISRAFYKLKTGQIIKYEFNQPFFDWFNSLPPIKECETLSPLNKEEINCVKTFFHQHIIDFVFEKTFAISLT